MAKPLFPKSLRKHIRLEKARIRREVSDSAESDELIQKLLERFLPQEKQMAEKPKAKKTEPQEQELAESAAKQ